MCTNLAVKASGRGVLGKAPPKPVPSPRRIASGSAEHTREMGLVGEAAMERQIAQRHRVIAQKRLRGR
jgi:hypothetical protein